MKKFKLTDKKRNELEYLYSLVSNCPKFEEPTMEEIEDYFLWSEWGIKKSTRYYSPQDPIITKDWTGWNKILWGKEWVGRMALIKKQFDNLDNLDNL